MFKNKEYQKKYYQKNKEKYLRRGIVYRKKHKEIIKKYMSKYYIKNKEKLNKINSAYNKKNIEKIRNLQKYYRFKNRVKLIKYRKSYYLKNKYKMNKQSSEYRKKNRIYLRAMYRNYRELNKEKIKLQHKIWVKNNSTKVLKIAAKFRRRNREIIRKKNLNCYYKHRKKYMILAKKYRKINKRKIKKLNIFRNYNKNKHCNCGRRIRNTSKHCVVCSLSKRRIKIELYKNIKMKSGWEVAYAKYLDKNRVKWLYEPKTFEFKNYRYTPDFYLPESDTYVEIKGWWRGNSKIKYYLFRKKFGNITLLKEQRLKKLGVLK
jgi:hypothetical protein